MPTNNPVDDTVGDPQTDEVIMYAPLAEWSIGQTCAGCQTQPDPDEALDGTWHDGTHNSALRNQIQSLTASFIFSGIVLSTL